MNKFISAFLSTLTAAAMLFSAAPAAAASADREAQTVEIQGEDISLQYIRTPYNGKEQKPEVTIKSGNTALVPDTDFTVTYPKDCVNAGRKTVKIKGMGKYTGRYSTTYMIEKLDCSAEDTDVKISIPSCVYTGLPLTPEVSVTVNGTALDSENFSLAFYDNINASGENKAKCDITFRGNYTGTRTAEFTVTKAPVKDIEFEIKAHKGEQVSFDLSALKPEGAKFGEVKYFSWDGVAEHQPRIAFNELIFTMPEMLGGSVLEIPVTNAANYLDYSLIFYPTDTDKIIPKAVMKPIEREYGGEPFTVEDIAKSGGYVSANGRILSGTWKFWTLPPTEPCVKTPCIVQFTPDDERYDAVDAIWYVTITRHRAEGFALKAARAEISPSQDGQLVVSGIPEDYKGTVSVRCGGGNKEVKITEVFCSDITRREYRVKFPEKSAQYTFTAQLSGDSAYLPASSECSITAGDYVPPEEKPSDKVTSPEELAALIESAAEGSTVKAEGMRSVPQNCVKTAGNKKLTLEVKINDSFTWVINTAKLSSAGALELDISMAVIPASLLDKLGGVNLYSFNTYASGLSDAARLRVTAGGKEKFANLFLYDTDGELVFISCAPITKGVSELSIKKPGKYAVIADNETRLPCDINNDCLADVDDVMELIRIILESDQSAADISKYDINGDKVLDVDDAMAAISIILNL